MDTIKRTTLTFAEIERLQALEGNPLTPHEIACQKRFERDGLTIEEQIEAIKADMAGPSIAAE